MSIPYLLVSILIVTRACSKMPELQCYRCSRSQLRCQNYILALSRCSSNPNAYVPIHASMIVSYTLEFSSLLAQKKVPDKGPDRLYRNPLIVRLISLRLAPSSKGVAGLHRSYVSPPLLIRDIKYSINIPPVFTIHLSVKMYFNYKILYRNCQFTLDECLNIV